MKFKYLFKTLVTIHFLGLLFSCSESATTYSEIAGEDEQPEINVQVDSSEMPLKDFVMETASEGLMQIKIAEIAMDKIEKPSVKQLAQEVISDREASRKQLKEVAEGFDWKIPDTMNDYDKEKVKEMESINKDWFYAKYLEYVEETHTNEIDSYMSVVEAIEAQKNKDENKGLKMLVDYMNDSIYMIEEHLDIAQVLKQNLIG